MPLLIIGHTTPRSTNVWVAGDAEHDHATVHLIPEDRTDAAAPIAPQTVPLRPDGSNTSVVTFEGLRPDTTYVVTANFAFRRRYGLRWHGSDVRCGRVRTFPTPHSASPFSFLHGSCNLSTSKLTNLSALAASFLGTWLGRRALGRDPRRWRRAGWNHLQRPLRWAWALASVSTHWLTELEQPEPMLPSPFADLAARVDGGEPAPRFMIHAGDQIYFDFPFPSREPTLDEYRREYRNTWLDDPHLQVLFASCPHYMAPDDHEFVNGAAIDALPSAGRSPSAALANGGQIYWDFVHQRHGPHRPPAPATRRTAAFDHTFEYGDVPFFLLDTRTTRRIDWGEMIDDAQLQRLQDWLLTHRNGLKFVVSSVPFVAQLRRDPAARRAREGAFDKWAGGPFEEQRRRILRLVHDHEVEKLVFLVGDMHCAYHAQIRLGAPQRRRTVHELAGGPIHQLDFSRVSDFEAQERGALSADGGDAIAFDYRLTQFHNGGTNLLRIDVERTPRTTVRWRVERTSKALVRATEPDTGGLFPTIRPTGGATRHAGRITF